VNYVIYGNHFVLYTPTPYVVVIVSQGCDQSMEKSWEIKKRPMGVDQPAQHESLLTSLLKVIAANLNASAMVK
jgi:hypothetical protein